MEATQPTFDGMAPRRRRKAPAKAARQKPAADLPVARVVLDVQAPHLGQPFDYFVDDKQAQAAQPGTLVRVRFGGQRVNGIVWGRCQASDTPDEAMRFIERVVSPEILVPASMRSDIAAIADAFGGTCANILRVAVPPRVAWVEQAQQASEPMEANRDARMALLAQRVEGDAQALADRMEGGANLIAALRQREGERRFEAFAADAFPGAGAWQRDLATMLATALGHGRQALAVLPGMRETWDLVRELERLGLRLFSPAEERPGSVAPANGERPRDAERVPYFGDVAVLSASMSPAERYRAYLAVSRGHVRCVVGTRAAMYAPVEGEALFAVVDDIAYQQADGMAPYANARGVLRLRARNHNGLFVAYGDVRSPLSQWETGGGHAVETSVSGLSTSVHPSGAALKGAMPAVRWLNRDELNRLADPSIGSRVPHTAVRVLSKALETGPVLLSIPSDGISESLSCASCLAQARCMKCSGPLERLQGDGTARCQWCGVTAASWTCRHCGGERLRVIRVGAAGTIEQLQGLFRHVPMVVSSPHQPQGVIEWISDAPVIVVATPGAEPHVRSSGDAAQGSYQATAILDAWTSLYMRGIDAREDALASWMRVVRQTAPRAQGGTALLIGESDPVLARSLMLWDSRLLAERENAERAETGLPPSVGAACVWGRRDAVSETLERIGVMPGGEWDVVEAPCGEVPAVLGPVPIALPKTIDARELESMGDRVKAVVRVGHARRDELALRLRTELARHAARRNTGELRFQMDPKDLM